MLMLFSFPMVHYGNHPSVNLKHGILLQWNLICTDDKDYEKTVESCNETQNADVIEIIKKHTREKGMKLIIVKNWILILL